MGEAGWVIVLLGVLSGCALVITVTMVVVACDVRRTLQHLNATLPECQAAVRQLHRSLAKAQRILTMVEQRTQQVDAVVERVAGTAGEFVNRLLTWKEQAKTFLGGRFGNGVGLGPHRRYRKS